MFGKTHYIIAGGRGSLYTSRWRSLGNTSFECSRLLYYNRVRFIGRKRRLGYNLNKTRNITFRLGHSLRGSIGNGTTLTRTYGLLL